MVYVDGHAEWHGWRFASTKRPPFPDAADLPMSIPYYERGDYYWVLSQTSVYQDPPPAVAADY
jgi:hypothetical protein